MCYVQQKDLNYKDSGKKMKAFLDWISLSKSE